MAQHFWPVKENRHPTEYLTDNGLHKYALEAIALDSKIERIWIPEVQVKSGTMRNACFYGCPINDLETRILNFTIRPSDLNVEFRYPHYLPLNIYDSLKWQNVSNTKYARFSVFGHDKLVKIIREYVDKLWNDYKENLLKISGKSALERDLRNRLNEIYPNEDILCNIRPDSMRSSKNKPLELDLFLEKRKVAIEVQGPKHYEDQRVQENDKLKVDWCKKNKVRLLWIKWQKAKDELLRMPGKEMEKNLKDLIESLEKSDSYFYHYE